eukprot:13044729-Alexandrium_andersonii.AAC.1
MTCPTCRHPSHRTTRDRSSSSDNPCGRQIQVQGKERRSASQTTGPGKGGEGWGEGSRPAYL